MARHTNQPDAPCTHITAQLALYLLEYAPHQLCGSKTSSDGSSRNSVLPISTVERKITSLQQALHATSSPRTATAATSAAPLKRKEGSNLPGSTDLSFSALMNNSYESKSPATASVSAFSSTTSSDCDTTSWEEDEEDTVLPYASHLEERSRMGAAVRALSRVRAETDGSDLAEENCGADIRRQPSSVDER